jgi:hypothetical protein
MNRLLGGNAASRLSLFGYTLDHVRPNGSPANSVAICGSFPGGQARKVVPVCRSVASSGSSGSAVLARVSRIDPASCTVTASGSIRRPAAARSSALLTHPLGYGFHLRRTLRKCRASALGGGPTR